MMKRSLSSLLLTLLLVSCGGGDDGAGPGGGGNNDTDPTPTTPGVANGTPTTGSFGPGGGTLTSSDGLFSITIPPDALPATSSAQGGTEITIQPITNTAWGGVGGGYRLLPDGLTFSAPVELNFSLEDSLLWGSDTLFVDGAQQQDNGVWGILKHRRIDWESRTLTCTTSHFSDYSMIEGLQLRPASAHVGHYSTVDLSVRYCNQQVVSGDDNLVGFVYDCSEDLAPAGTFSNWAVNGINGGSATFGSIGQTGGNRARYTAPSETPDPNIVAVSVKARGRRGTTLLVSNITISGSWVGTVVVTQGTRTSHAYVVWDQIASYQGYETYRPSGYVEYTPDTDYGPVCSFVSMDPRRADIQANLGALIINFNMTPPMVSGYGTVAVIATTCFICDGWDAPDCQDGVLPDWFGADSLAVTNNGNTIYADITDNGQLPAVHAVINFTKD